MFLRDCKEFCELIWINLRTSIYDFVEFIQIVVKYYQNPQFRKLDLALFRTYLFKSPFAMSKQFLLEQGAEDPYQYGETPLTTLEKIAKECELSSQDRFFELGCGRGRTCFWISIFVGCHVTGIDNVPDFIEKANAIKKKYQLTKVDFLLQNMFKADYSSATILYLYASNLNHVEIAQLANRLCSLRPGTKVISVSFPIQSPSFDFEVVKQFPASFTWGTADVFINIKK